MSECDEGSYGYMRSRRWARVQNGKCPYEKRMSGHRGRHVKTEGGGQGNEMMSVHKPRRGCPEGNNPADTSPETYSFQNCEEASFLVIEPPTVYGNPLQHLCLENPMDRGAWWATVHVVTKSRTRLSDQHFHSFTVKAAPENYSTLH